jgi:hypothetical protein
VFRVAGEVMATWSSRMNETKPVELKGNAAAEDASVAASTDTGRPDDVKTEMGSKVGLPALLTRHEGTCMTG